MAAVGNTGKPISAWVDGPIVPGESGNGGWTVVPQEGGIGTVEYSGVEPRRWTLPIMLDGWSEDADIQPRWDEISALSEQLGTEPPPQVWFAGTIPVPVAAQPWLIEKFTPVEEERLHGEGALYRAKATLVLLDPSTGTNVSSPIAQARAASSGSKAGRTIRARKGDTLVTIAARELGDPARWRDISNLNGHLQPDNVRANQKIKLPSS